MRAVQVTALFFYSLGYLAFLKLFRDVFGYSERVSHLSSLLFILNGFSFGHLFVGHVTHQTYLLIPFFLYSLLRFEPTGIWEKLGRVSSFSLAVTYTLYSGGVHTLVVFFFCSLLLLPYLVLVKSKRGEGKDFTLFAILSTASIALACWESSRHRIFTRKTSSRGAFIFPPKGPFRFSGAIFGRHPLRRRKGLDLE